MEEADSCGGVLTLSIGIYQSYFAVSLTLILLILLMDLLNGKGSKYVFWRGMRGAYIALIGGILYFIVSNLICFLTGYSLESRVSILAGSTNYLVLIVKSYLYYGRWLLQYKLGMPCVFLLANILICLGCVIIVCCFLWRNKSLKWVDKLFIIALGTVLPFFMDITYFLAKGVEVHDLTTYAINFTYLLFLILISWAVRKPGILASCGRICKGVAAAAISIILLSNIVNSNTAYLKKDLEQKSTLSTMTRVVARMEETEGYVPGETPVVFIGTPGLTDGVTPGFERISTLIGMDRKDDIFCNVLLERYNPEGELLRIYEPYAAYFRYILNCPINLCEKTRRDAITDLDEVESMKSYPDKSCIQMVDGVMVVKISEYK